MADSTLCLLGGIAMCFERACEITSELRVDNAITDDVATHAIEILSISADAENGVQTLEKLMLFLKHNVEAEKKIWENIIMEIPWELLSDEVIAYLYSNHIAISQNTNTPESILNELTNLRKTKDASAIRLNAANTLKIKKKLQKEWNGEV